MTTLDPAQTPPTMDPAEAARLVDSGAVKRIVFVHGNAVVDMASKAYLVEQQAKEDAEDFDEARHHDVPLFQTGTFKLASGASSAWKIECDALSPADWMALAVMVAEEVGGFSQVFGVPRGGFPLQHALEKYVTPGSPYVLIVDDVWTTGGSMRRYIETLASTAYANRQIKKAVVFARGPLDEDVMALFATPLAVR